MHEQIELEYDHLGTWTAKVWVKDKIKDQLGHFINHIVLGQGPTPLIAAMRCYVANKFGDEVNE